MGLRSVLFEHPLAKALGFNLLGILGTIFGGAYIFEITKPLPNGGQYLDWRSFAHTYSFWLLAGVLLLMGLYSWGVERFDKKVQRALSNAEKKEQAYMALMPTMLDAIKKEIEAGRVKTFPEVLAILGLEEDKK